MSRQHSVALTVTTLLGVAVGGFVLWKGIQRRRSKTRCVTQEQQKGPDCRELPSPEAVRLHSSAPRASWEERILQAKVVTVSQEEEWDQTEPLLKSELEDFPVLGFDCEWVNLEGRVSPLSLLQMASPSGLCVLVRLPKLIRGGKTLPRTLLDILADGTILKVGVGCSEDASKLLEDYGLVVKGYLDLRYLAMRQRCGVYACWDICSNGANVLARFVDSWKSLMKYLKLFGSQEVSQMHIDFVRKRSIF